MSKSGSGFGFAAAAAAVVVSIAGCSTGSPPTATTAGATLSQPTPVSAGGRLIVLAAGPNGGRGLWSLSPDYHWTALADTPTATAIGRTADGLAVVTSAGVEVRKASDLSKPATVMTLKWVGKKPAAPIVGVDYSAAGKAALVMADDTTLSYAVAGLDGTVAALTPAPTQSFSPLVAWLDEGRLLVLSTDNQQVSMLAVIDVAAHTMDQSGGLSGVRVFALSQDRRSIAAATETAVYAGPFLTIAGSSVPAPIVTLAEGQVVWALALDTSGSRLFLLSGSIAADGSVGGVHELGYTRQGSSWQKVLDSAVPFGRALGQVYLAS
jgi:hypothetical protein